MKRTFQAGESEQRHGGALGREWAGGGWRGGRAGFGEPDAEQQLGAN